MKKLITENIIKVLLALNYPTDQVNVQKTKNPEHGDYSSNIAMILAKKIKKNPIDTANEIINKINDFYGENFSKVNIAGPGFINFKISEEILFEQLKKIIEENENFGKTNIGANKKALVEFVSANPTGPLTIGHGRGAILGDTVTNILKWIFPIKLRYLDYLES